MTKDEWYRQLFERLDNSKFRSSFHLKQKDIDYINEKGLDTIRQHAKDFIAKREAPAYIANDGKQTPMRGHPVFIAQHATATCCRECIRKWYKMQPGKELSQVQQDLSWRCNYDMDSKRNGEAGTYNMSLKNVLIIVDNIDESINFYEELFGLRVITRLEGNVIMSEGLVLQDVDVWYDSTKIHTTPHNNMTELYFEDNDIEGIIEKLESGKYVVSYVTDLMELECGQKLVRFYDPSGNLIEVRTPVSYN